MAQFIVRCKKCGEWWGLDWPEQQEYTCHWCGSSELDYKIDTEEPLTKCHFGVFRDEWIFVKTAGLDFYIYLPPEKTAPYLPVSLGKPPEIEEVVVDPLLRVLPLETWKREEVVVVYPAKMGIKKWERRIEDLILASNIPEAVYNVRTRSWISDGFLIFFKDGSVFEKGLTLADIL